MTRRYYRVRPLEDLHRTELDGQPVVLGRYRFQERTRHLAAACVELDEAAAVARAFADFAAELPDGELAVLDLTPSMCSRHPPARSSPRICPPRSPRSRCRARFTGS
jgi:hypothetical protein